MIAHEVLRSIILYCIAVSSSSSFSNLLLWVCTLHWNGDNIDEWLSHVKSESLFYSPPSLPFLWIWLHPSLLSSLPLPSPPSHLSLHPTSPTLPPPTSLLTSPSFPHSTLPSFPFVYPPSIASFPFLPLQYVLLGGLGIFVLLHRE